MGTYIQTLWLRAAIHPGLSSGNGKFGEPPLLQLRKLSY